MIEGLEEEPHEVIIGTSMMIGSYMLVFRKHHGHPRIQVLLQDGVETLGEAWHDPHELSKLIGIVAG